jgi:hypothetical protein
MSTIAKFERDCAYCRQPIRLKWKEGLIPPEGACLVADQIFHDECWNKYWAKYDTLPETGRELKGNGGLEPLAAERFPQKAAPPALRATGGRACAARARKVAPPGIL